MNKIRIIHVILVAVLCFAQMVAKIHAVGHADDHIHEGLDRSSLLGHSDASHKSASKIALATDQHAQHDADTHASLLASYSFNCDDVSNLKNIDVLLLNIWPDFEDLDVQLIGPGGQAALELDQQQSLIDLTQAQ